MNWPGVTKRSERVRQAACAGRFYAAAPEKLRTEVQHCLAAAQPTTGPAPKAMIVPHAGYLYSGPVAGSGYVRLAGSREQVRKVVLLGPSHYADFVGIATSGAAAFATPLGEVPLDTTAALRLAQRGLIHENEAAHRPEHCLEVQLPFLQLVLTEFTLVPLLVGRADDEAISEVIDALWGGTETLVLVSSDLSHYHDYVSAHALDEATAQAIVALQPGNLSHTAACGCKPIRGLLNVVKRRSLGCELVDLRSSGDTAGPRDRVVGYGAFLFHASAKCPDADSKGEGNVGEEPRVSV